MRLRDADYEDLLTLRTGLRRLMRWSEQQAEAAGLTPAQHQLLLTIRGHPDRRGPTVGEVADYLLLRHHSAVGLVDRAVAAGLVKRIREPQDHRVVRLQLTAAANKRLEALSELHLEELERLSLKLPTAWRGLMPRQPLHGIETRG
jgi:DNA-binding MarR family transcriptional regulator